ncbi:MAG: DUF4442 domain-containing protein [Sulfitobacter sp.]
MPLANLPPESWRSRGIRWVFNFFPAFRRTGGRIIHLSADEEFVRLKLPLNLFTKNPFGTLFGGSMYSAVDPIYVAFFSRRLGKRVSVWDKKGTIQHILPGRTALFADFHINDNEVAEIREELSRSGRVDRTYTVELMTGSGELCAAVTKTLAFRQSGALIQPNS